MQLPLPTVVLQTCGSLPGKQSPAHSVAFQSVSELGETKAACWIHSNPTVTGCFPPEEGRTEVLKWRADTESSSLGHLSGSSGREEHRGQGGKTRTNCDLSRPWLKGLHCSPLCSPACAHKHCSAVKSHSQTEAS